MLLGETLIGSRDANETELLEIKENLPDRLDALLPDYVLENSELVESIHRLVSVSPQGRYPSAREAEVGDEGLKVIDRQLVQQGLVREVGRDPNQGNAILYGTTRTFLEKFGLNDLADLPPLEEFAPDPQTETAIRAAGKLRVEGKQYVMQDGDVCHFLFNV